jgi:hypothetical protein
MSFAYCNYISSDNKKERLITLSKRFIVLDLSDTGIVGYNSPFGKKVYLRYYGFIVIYNEEQIPCLWDLFICSLFNDTISNSGYMAMNDWMVANNESKRM